VAAEWHRIGAWARAGGLARLRELADGADTVAETPPVRASAYRKAATMSEPPTEEHGPPAPPEPPADVRDPSPDGGDNIWARLKQAFWGSTRRRLASVTLALLLALVVVGGVAEAINGGSTRSLATNLPEPSTPESPEAATTEAADCTTGPVEHNIRVTVYGASAEVCTGLNRQVAQKDGEYWRVVPTGNRVEGSQLVCSMAKGGELIEVRDTGEHHYGNRFCAGLTAESWTEKEGPGERAEREHKQQQEKEKEAEQHAQAQKVEEERPEHEAAAAKLRAEAGSVHRKEKHEEALVKADEAEAEHLEGVAGHVESEEPSEGGAGKDEQATKIREQANGSREHADAHRSNVDSLKSDAEAKEREAKEEAEKE
jgi:hypothetical protein